MGSLTAITQEALYLVLITSAPAVVLSLVVGLIVAVFQAATHIQEQTLSFAPKVIVVFGSLAIGGGWMGSQLVRFATQLFDRFPSMLGQ